VRVEAGSLPAETLKDFKTDPGMVLAVPGGDTAFECVVAKGESTIITVHIFTPLKNFRISLQRFTDI
jgi:hypothetical protein